MNDGMGNYSASIAAILATAFTNTASHPGNRLRLELIRYVFT
jgi:hypothetical protein